MRITPTREGRQTRRLRGRAMVILEEDLGQANRLKDAKCRISMTRDIKRHKSRSTNTSQAEGEGAGGPSTLKKN